MNRILLPILMLGLSLAPVLCRPAEPHLGQQKAVAPKAAANWKDLRALDAAWRQQWQADWNLGRNETALGRKTWITEVDSFASVIVRCVPYEYRYALMLELTRRNAKLDASAEFLKIAPEGFAELFGVDRAALVTLFSRRCPETIHDIPVDVWIAGLHFDAPPLTEKNQGKRPDWSDGLYNGILVLCDAFDQSGDAATRAVISRALQHAFRPYVTQVADDSQIADVCREWFAAHRKEFYVSVGPWMPSRSPLCDPATAALFQPLGPQKK